MSFLGPEGTYSHLAALSHFGEQAELVPVPTILEAFRAVAEARTPRGLVPIENSTEGSVGVALDGLLECAVTIEAEVLLEIRHCLLAVHDDLGEIKRVFSHPQALGQCRDWLSKQLPNRELVMLDSTTAAASAAQNDPHGAAIASAQAARRYGLSVVRTDIQDVRENITRFLVLARETPPPTGRDKTSLAFSTRHERGALRRALEVFDGEGLNLSRIESRPKRNALWEYTFFVDLEGHIEDPAVSRAVERLSQLSGMCKVLGSYPKARTTRADEPASPA